jgi:hypothetical protein
MRIVKKYKFAMSILVVYFLSLLLPFNSVLSSVTYGYVSRNGINYFSLSWKYPIFLALTLVIFFLIRNEYKKWVMLLSVLIVIVWYLAYPIAYARVSVNYFFEVFRLFHIGYYLSFGILLIFLVIVWKAKNKV